MINIENIKSKSTFFLFWTAIFSILLSIVSYTNCLDFDIWHRFIVGEHFLNSGSLFQKDVFSYMPVKDIWIDHEWGSGVIFYFIYFLFPKSGLLWFKLVMYGLTFYFTFKACNTYKKSFFDLFYSIIIILGLFNAFSTTIRSHVFTYFFFSLWLYILIKMEKTKVYKLACLFPVVLVFWVNLHGGFLAGIGLLFLYSFKSYKKISKLCGIWIFIFLCCLIVLINPYGFDFIKYMFEAVTLNRYEILEWQSLSFFKLSTSNFIKWGGFYFFVGLFVTQIIYKVVINNSIKNSWIDIGIQSVLLVLAILHRRHASFFIILSSVYSYEIYIHLKEKIISLLKLNKFRLFFLIFFKFNVIIISMYVLTNRTFEVDAYEDIYPVKVSEYILKNKLRGNLLTHFNDGSYLLWFLKDEMKVSIDGRFEEVYKYDTYNDIQDFYNNRANLDLFLSKFHHDYILVYKNTKLSTNLMSKKNIEKIFSDNRYLLLKIC